MKENSKNLPEGPSHPKEQELARGEEEALGSAVNVPSNGPVESPDSPPPLPDSKEILKEKMENYWEQLLRLQAEFSNYRKRTEKEKSEAIRLGREIMIEKMISLTDVMESAIRHSQNTTNIDSLREGFEMVHREFLCFLKSEGVEPLKTVGESFDPHLHEAIEQIETSKEEENNFILEEVQTGYTFNGHLLRPAKVKVAKKVQ